ncbi:MAG: SDR family NAD(P)-dependent oxidoreductase [Ketobacteraceae bacterium]|nr:SDR family NAD(P)-dependent oxidoreductase [Ketobacteraceae bacterium]
MTGASSGFGHYFAEELAARGAHVVAVARRRERLDALVDRIETDGGKCLGIAMDVADSTSVTAGLDEMEEKLGLPNVIINNAGVGCDAPFLQLTEEDWDNTLNTNLKGAFLLSQFAIKRIVERGDGAAVINIASILGERVAGNVAPYAVSKAGLIQLTKAMALELARYQIRVNAIAPGYVETDINRHFFETELGARMIKKIPQRELGQVEDLLGPLLLLASDASRYMTGSVIAVDGGHLVNSL